MCHTQPSSHVNDDDDDDDDDATVQQMIECCSTVLWDDSAEDQEAREQESTHFEVGEYLGSSARRYTSESFLAQQEEEHSPDSAAPMETLTFEAAVATSLGRANTVSASMRTRSRVGWQVPNGHFRKRLAQSLSLAGGETLSDADDDKY